ncbi:type I restriction enzyme HsdR N-terminal domain-containing protein [Adhaeribacter soli]|uniref:Type I restriction enzyme HsdR N-terminal domain-containing protein n=1 Tax=Adhaeribacter soli TaxID=2607655 RepID=A0A5N1IXH8_9BACT|nr:type I restriction enzyme HsdR N-terminal domain-containing protein [Adhaeribacter soli]KAA9332772.1 type I restriction enzyme HsdR N-terminal domain-containing protein [Adhaeribacter soli]
MQALNLPAYDCKLKHSDGNSFIFDPVRKKYVLLTPEEWVRQHFLHYLTEHLAYPKTLFSIEKGMTYNRLQKRTDLRVYSSAGLPLVLVECKAAGVAISAETVKQASVYNQTLKAPYVMLTNGLDHYCWKVDFAASRYVPLAEIPVFSQLG